jgi:hypothetical protein
MTIFGLPNIIRRSSGAYQMIHLMNLQQSFMDNL